MHANPNRKRGGSRRTGGGMRVLSRLRGSLAQRTLPALQLTFVRCWRGPGAPALRERPAAPCHPQTRTLTNPRSVVFVQKEGFGGATDRRGGATGVRVAQGGEA